MRNAHTAEDCKNMYIDGGTKERSTHNWNAIISPASAETLIEDLDQHPKIGRSKTHEVGLKASWPLLPTVTLYVSAEARENSMDTATIDKTRTRCMMFNINSSCPRELSTQQALNIDTHSP